MVIELVLLQSHTPALGSWIIERGIFMCIVYKYLLTAGLREQYINATQLWPGILKFSLNVGLKYRSHAGDIRILQAAVWRNSVPVRVYLLKHTANEMLEWTTDEQDSGLEPEDPDKRLLKEPSLLPKAVCLIFFHCRFSVQFWPLQAPFLPLKAIVSCISRTCDFWPKTYAAYVQVFTVHVYCLLLRVWLWIADLLEHCMTRQLP